MLLQITDLLENRRRSESLFVLQLTATISITMVAGFPSALLLVFLALAGCASVLSHVPVGYGECLTCVFVVVVVVVDGRGGVGVTATSTSILS